MMTVGNNARMQVTMAQVQTNYGSQLDSLYASKLGKFNSSSKSAMQSLEDLLKSDKLKNKDANYREQFSNLYKSIYGISDDDSSDDSVSSKQSIKAASQSAGNAAESIKGFADSLKYKDELDTDSYRKYAQSFVDSYNAMVDKVGNSDDQKILQKGVLMVNTGKVYTSTLKRAGIVVGSDNKLSVSSDLSKVTAVNVKSAFGTYGFSDKVIDKAGQINSLSGGSGSFIRNVSNAKDPSSSTTDNITSNAKTMKDLAAAVKELATEMKSYASGFGDEEKEFIPTDYTDTANKFIGKYNEFLEAAKNSDKATIRTNGNSMNSITNSYKYALKRAGIEVGKDGKLSLSKDTDEITTSDIMYAFSKDGGYMDKVIQKAEQANALVTGASAMGYNSDKTTTYAYNSGALYSTYA